MVQLQYPLNFKTEQCPPNLLLINTLPLSFRQIQQSQFFFSKNISNKILNLKFKVHYNGFRSRTIDVHVFDGQISPLLLSMCLMIMPHAY